MPKSIKHQSTSKRATLPGNALLNHTKSILTAALIIMPFYAVTSHAFGQVEFDTEISANDPEILAIVEEIVADKDNLPGMVAAIYEKGKPLRIAATGVRKIGTDEALTTDNVTHLGSCTKAMTATAIGRLMEQGKIKLDAKIEESLVNGRSAQIPLNTTSTVRSRVEPEKPLKVMQVDFQAAADRWDEVSQTVAKIFE